MKWIPVVSLASLLALGGTAYALLAQEDGMGVPATTAGDPHAPAPARTPHAELMAARRTCRIADLDALVDRRRRDVQDRPQDGTAWCDLAEALLERVLQRNHLRGMTVGRPIHDELPAAVAADLDAGLAAIAKARGLGLDSAESHRIEAGLIGNRITGLASALRFNPLVQEALAKAFAREPGSPALHVALGLRKLLAPRLLGHDPGKALQHFEFAAQALSDDERPGVFAAMAAYLGGRRQKAIEWLERAVANNPDNAFARVVLERVRRDDTDPFGRDVTPGEAAMPR